MGMLRGLRYGSPGIVYVSVVRKYAIPSTTKGVSQCNHIVLTVLLKALNSQRAVGDGGRGALGGVGKNEPEDTKKNETSKPAVVIRMAKGLE
jgi:hypothetical protein